MSTFTLPEGYTFDPPETMVLSDIPQMQEYGGATVTQAWDASGAHFIALCCKNPAGLFRFRVFREDAPEHWREIPIAGDCDGRGSIGVSAFDGALRWIAWKGNQFFSGTVPEAQPFAPSLAPEQAMLVWPADYASQAEVLDGQLHVRLNKIKAALLQLQSIAKRARWLK